MNKFSYDIYEPLKIPMQQITQKIRQTTISYVANTYTSILQTFTSLPSYLVWILLRNDGMKVIKMEI